MPHRITEECLACGICADECPNSAISEGDEIFQIDTEMCNDCGTCLDVCPNEGAIVRS